MFIILAVNEDDDILHEQIACITEDEEYANLRLQEITNHPLWTKQYTTFYKCFIEETYHVEQGSSN